MQNPAEDPPDAWVEGEFTFARLRYRSFRRGRWGTDANKGDRLFIIALRSGTTPLLCLPRRVVTLVAGRPHLIPVFEAI